MRGKKIFKKIFAFVLTVAIILQVQTPVDADAAWKLDNVGWWWQEDDGSYAANEWQMINGVWYHFNSSGYMDTGWIYDGGVWYYLDGSGAMLTGWQNIGGIYYYMYPSGAMAADTWIDGYYVNASGAWVVDATNNTASTGWINYNGKWCYKKADGSYVMADWLALGNTWYYFDAEGYMVTGWQLIAGYWYYFAEDGHMLSSQWVGNSWVGSDGNWECTEQDQTYTIDLGNGQTTTVVGHFDEAYATRVVYLLNQHRLANNVPALAEESVIKSAANLRAYELVYSFSHTRPNGTTCFTACDSAYGENIAYGYGTPEAVMEAWTNSTGHNENMLESRYETIGIGVFAEATTYGYRYYWVQLFGINY